MFLNNVIRITKPENLEHVNFFPKTVFINKSDIKKIELNDFIYYESVEMCGYGYSPCTHNKPN